MALFILVLRLLTGAMFLQQHLIRGVCTRHGPNKKEGPWNCQRQRVGTAVKVTQLPLKGHYVCCSRSAQFFCQHPPASDPWQTPRRAATNMAGTKGHVLPRVLSRVVDFAPHIMRWPAQSPPVSINGGSKTPMWIIAVYLREELELQSRWCFKLFVGNWNLSNKHHLCEVQHHSSCCRNPSTCKPVFFLKEQKECYLTCVC